MTNNLIVTARSSKSSMRDELRKKTEEFLKRGGEIKQHNQGETGEPADKPRARSVFVSGEPRQTRTYINDVVSALDSRKKKKGPTQTGSKSASAQKRKSSMMILVSQSAKCGPTSQKRPNQPYSGLVTSSP